MGGALSQWGVSVFTHFLIAMPILAVCGFIVAGFLPESSTSGSDIPSKNNKELSPDAGENSKLFRWPSRSILLLCLMPIGIMMVEGAFIDWSAVFMRDIMFAEPIIIAITYSAFSLVMALVRLFGDHLATRFGDLWIIKVSGIATTIGITGFALAPGIPWAFFAAAIAGAGVAIVFPLAVTAAANRPNSSSADNVAALNMIAFSAFFFAPPIIGFVSELFSLRVALLMLAPVALGTWFLAKEILPREQH